MDVRFLGAAGEVTGSCHLIRTGDSLVLLDCGLIQGSRKDEARNAEPFPFDPKQIDAVVLSHAHIDHSGRIPLLVKAGFRGTIYTQHASKDLCRIMLEDAGHLNEREAEWQNRKRERKGLEPVEPLYTVQDAQDALRQFKGVAYGDKQEILPGVALRLSDAGHILGSAIVEVWLEEGEQQRKLVFSGDLGRVGAPILRDPAVIQHADLVLMESTYGNRLHRSPEDTRHEIEDLVAAARHAKGNILIPAFAVGRTQGILYEFARNYDAWGLDRWQLFLDSPMAIAATEVYARHTDLYDAEAAALWGTDGGRSLLPNLHLSRTAAESMGINRIRSGAVIVAASGMCTGGRIKHHLKHNAWRSDCHIVIVGFQARGTVGRALVDGARHIRLWGETIRVAARVHTIGGLSAHADQDGLVAWYRGFRNRPPLILVHGESESAQALQERVAGELNNSVRVAGPGECVDLLRPTPF
jgi:metallo-beta-lactamase family protein